MPWLQLRIHTHRDNVARVEAAMQGQGALSVTFEDSADEAIFEPALGEIPLWPKTRVTGLFEASVDTTPTLEKILRDCGKSPIAGHWHTLEDKDWQREWMRHFKPIQCGDNFWVCPSWANSPAPDAINLILDPGLAFGTGTHPTTFLCLQWLVKASIEGRIVIDYGCGSGILGIAALLLGAESVSGIDIDPQALVATQENIRRNSLNPKRFPVFCPEKFIKHEADLVFANILAGPIVDLAPHLISLLKPGGRLCLSGILTSQKQAVIDVYSEHTMIESVTEKEGWVCILALAKASI